MCSIELLLSLDRLFWRVVVVGLNSPNTSCETPKGIQCCKMSIPLGVSQVVSYYKEWWKSGGRGWSNRILSSQLQFLESYKPMSKGKPCSRI